MGMFTMFLKARLLQKLLGVFARGSHGAQMGRSGGLLAKPAGKAVAAAIAAMLVKRALRRR